MTVKLSDLDLAALLRLWKFVLRHRTESVAAGLLLLSGCAGGILRRQLRSPLHAVLAFAAPAAWATLVFWLAFVKGEEIGMPPEHMVQNVFLALAPALGVALGLITPSSRNRSRASV